MRLVPIVFFASCVSLGAVGAACGSSNSGSPGAPGDAGMTGDTSMEGDDSSTPASDGGADGAIGYPALVPTDVPQVTTESGPVMTAPKIVPIFYAADVQTTVASLTDFTQKVGQTQYWKTITTEYGSGPATSLTPIQITDTLPAMYD